MSTIPMGGGAPGGWSFWVRKLAGVRTLLLGAVLSPADNENNREANQTEGMKKVRAKFVMVDESDGQFVRFWHAYPRRVSKKDARKAWAELAPSSDVVDAMIQALDWQVPLNRWAGAKYDYAPYPASWLNARRWEDEPPPALAALKPWVCPHLVRCTNREMCKQATILGRPVRDMAVKA